MKTYLTIITIAILYGCSVKPKYIYVAHLDVKELGANFVDSLLQTGVDTIMSYYDGCAGCIPGTIKSVWVYWENKGHSSITKFTNYAKYKPYQISFEREFEFIASQISLLKNESIDREYSIFDHYAYEEFQIVSPSDSYKFMITDDATRRNQGSYSVLVIDKFKSIIYESYDWIWQGYDYKKEKRKRVPNKN